MDVGDALLNGLDTAVHLGDHAAGDGALILQALHVGDVQIADHVPELDVVAQPLDVGEEHQLLGAQGAGQLAGGGVAVDVEALSLSVGAHGGHHGDVARVQQGLHRGGVDLHDVAHEAQLLAALDALIDVGADAGQAHGLAADGVDAAHQLAVHLADEHRLHHMDDVRGGIAQAVDELHGDVQLLQHLVDAGAAPVAEDGLQPQQLEHHHVLEDGGLQLLIDHGVAAVLDDDDFAGILLQIGHGLH